eukprot:9501450-Lingulodinium_polyedra.AAC.1
MVLTTMMMTMMMMMMLAPRGAPRAVRPRPRLTTVPTQWTRPRQRRMASTCRLRSWLPQLVLAAWPGT